MAGNEIKCRRLFAVEEYHHAEMEAKESRLALSKVIGYEHGYKTRLKSSNDIYQYEGEIIANGVFKGFMDPEHTIVEIGSMVYKNGVKILDQSKFGTSYRGGRLFEPDKSKLFFADNVIVRMTNGVAVFYDDKGNEVKEIDADEFLGVDRETKQSAFLVNGEVFVYDHSKPQEIKKAVIENSRLQDFTIYERSLYKYTEDDDLPRSLGKDVVYDENNQPVQLSSLYRFLDGEPYEYHGRHFTIPDIEVDFSEIGKMNFFENKTTILLDDSGIGFIYETTNSSESKRQSHLYTDYAKIEPYIRKNAEALGLELPKEKEENIFDIQFTPNLSFASLKDAQKMKKIEAVLAGDPEKVQELPATIIAKYILMHPEQKELGGYIKKSDTLSDMVLKQLNDIGVNPLQPFEFRRALSGEQKLQTCSKKFKIENADDFKFAFKQLSYTLRDDNPINVEIAEMLLVKLVKQHKDKFFEGQSAKGIYDIVSYGHPSCKREDVVNALVMLQTKGIEFIDPGNINESRELKEIINPKYLKKLADQGRVTIDVKDYFERPIDSLCPVNQTFCDPFAGKGKINLLDYFLQRGKADKVVDLLNHGADVFVNVDRYSKKQDKLFPIKPFARFIDTQIFLNKTRQLEDMMSAIARGIDASKEDVIDKIFESLPRKTKDNETVKKLRENMHLIFERTHLKEGGKTQEDKSDKFKLLEDSHQFYLMHKEEFMELDERRRLAQGEPKGTYHPVYADEYVIDKGYRGFGYYDEEYLESQRKSVASIEESAIKRNVEKNFNRFLQLSVGDNPKSIQERLDDVRLRFVVKDGQIEVIDKTERDGQSAGYNAPIAINKDVLFNIDRFLLEKETILGLVNTDTRQFGTHSEQENGKKASSITNFPFFMKQLQETLNKR